MDCADGIGARDRAVVVLADEAADEPAPADWAGRVGIDNRTCAVAARQTADVVVEGGCGHGAGGIGMHDGAIVVTDEPADVGAEVGAADATRVVNIDDRAAIDAGETAGAVAATDRSADQAEIADGAEGKAEQARIKVRTPVDREVRNRVPETFEDSLETVVEEVSRAVDAERYPVRGCRRVERRCQRIIAGEIVVDVLNIAHRIEQRVGGAIDRQAAAVVGAAKVDAVALSEGQFEQGRAGHGRRVMARAQRHARRRR